MSLDDEVKLLKQIPLFANLDVSKLKLLAFTSEWLQFGEGETLVREGESGDCAFVITHGEAVVMVHSPDGETEVAVRGVGDIIGETAILCEVPRTATVRARGNVSTLKISKKVFVELITGNPEVAVEVIRVLGSRLESATQQLSDARAEKKQ